MSRSVDLELDEDDIVALSALAIRLEDSGDLDGAILLYKIGIHFHDTVCMTRLANILSEPPTFKDVQLAEALYKRACIAGHAAGCANLAVLYQQLGKTQLSQKYMKLAKERGDPWQDDNDE
jgi:hypothetical protein